MRPTLVPPDLVEVARQLRDRGTPVVAYGHSEGLGFDYVTSDHAAGCEELCRWLISQGRRRILRVWEHTSSQSRIPEWRRQRDIGYERAMQAAGLEVIPMLDIPAFPEAFIQSREDFEMRARLVLGYLWGHLSGPDPVDAILALTDGPSFAVTSACRLMGKEPNRDVTIVGYDNYWQDSPNRQWEPTGPAATVDKRNIELGRELMVLLQARAEGGLPPEPQVRLLKPVLQVTGGV
jgi:DNA-binding LacI/PurR family transcriptional regulator